MFYLSLYFLCDVNINWIGVPLSQFEGMRLNNILGFYFFRVWNVFR